MKSALVLLSLVALSQAGLLKPRSLDSRIINGEEVKLGEIPYQVSIQTLDNFHFCGGSILNKNYVITAAHCVNERRRDSIKVISGSIHLDDPKSTHTVIDIHSHEKYNPRDAWVNDIAVVKVAEEFQVSETVSFVPLPERNQHVPADTVAVISGWGRTRFNGPSPKELLRAQIYISDQSYCAELYAPSGYTIHDGQICANEPTAPTGPCHGDSGGPLTVDGKIVGIFSWSTGCARPSHPTVYTRVSEYLDWIESNTV